jgi:glycosyltransferase involved in cell wall biosynthesis
MANPIVSPDPSPQYAAPSAEFRPEDGQPPLVFVFLEIFNQEGGIQSYSRMLLDACSQLAEVPAIEVFLLRDRPGLGQQFSGMAFHYFQSASATMGRLNLAIALFSHLFTRRPRHVYCGHINLAPLVAVLCQPLGIPYTVITHGKEVWPPLPPLTRWAMQNATTLWAVSRYTRDRTCRVNQLDPDKFRLMPCAVDGDCFTPAPKSPALVEKYGLDGAIVLVTVARLWSGDIYKGVDVTIRALPRIVQAFPQVKYLVVGRGDDQPRLAALAADLGVGDRVVFAGFVPTEELVQHYRLADAYVMPSQEGFGIVYLEAMACGVPVIAGDDDGSSEPLLDGKLGWRVPHRDPEAVATACIELLTSKFSPQAEKVDRRCDGDWLRQQVLETFSYTAFSRRVAQRLADASSDSPH